MQLLLDRRLAERRIFPAIDIARSGTRREELLLDPSTLRQVYLLRRLVGMMSTTAVGPTDATERVLERLWRTSDNAEFMASLKVRGGVSLRASRSGEAPGGRTPARRRQPVTSANERVLAG
jgi:transcription termination factor Rho